MKRKNGGEDGGRPSQADPIQFGEPGTQVQFRLDPGTATGNVVKPNRKPRKAQ